MATERRKQLLLGALLVVLAVVSYRAWQPPSAPPGPTSNGRGAAKAQRKAPAASPTTDVHLEALSEERPKPSNSERNLFRFRPKPPPPPPRPAFSPPPVAQAPTGPPLPPPPPPIPYKFIGFAEVPGRGKRIAVLSDGRGAPVYGGEGDIIEGRFRILRIGAESIEMEYLDGRGRQTIRLSGS